MFEWNEKYLLSHPNQPMFIDREPDKFRKILNYLRNIDSDPGLYAEFYQIKRSSIRYHTNNEYKLPAKRESLPIQIQDQPIEIDDEDNIKRLHFQMSCRLDKWTINNKFRYSTVSKETKKEHTIYLDYKLARFYLCNLRFITNTGIKSISLSLNNNYIYVDDARNSNMLKNLQNLPHLYVYPWAQYKVEVELTRPGFLQILYNGVDYKEINKIGKQMCKYQHTYYYGRTDTITRRPPYFTNTSTLIIKKNSDFDTLILSYHHMIITTIDEVSDQMMYDRDPKLSRD
jgi:hypothetical protein